MADPEIQVRIAAGTRTARALHTSSRVARYLFVIALTFLRKLLTANRFFSLRAEHPDGPDHEAGAERLPVGSEGGGGAETHTASGPAWCASCVAIPA